MRLRAGLVKIGIMASLTLASTYAQASNEYDTNTQCAAYMDIALKDLYPVGAMQRSKAVEMTTGRYTRLAAVTMIDNISIDQAVNDFTSARDSARQDLSRQYPVALSSADSLYRYASGIDAKTNQHCIPSNRDLMEVVQTYSKQALLDRAIAVSKVMKARGES